MPRYYPGTTLVLPWYYPSTTQYFPRYAEDKFDPIHPRHISPPVVYLGSTACTIGGAVLLVDGPKVRALVPP